jgi:WD40 repeat protein
VAFGPRGGWLAAGGHDGSVFLWETGRGGARSLRRLKGDGGHEGTVFGVAFDAAETTLASVGIDRRVVLWRLDEARTWKPGEALPVGEPFPALPERLYAVEFDPARPERLALAAGPSVFVIDTARGASPLAERLEAPDAPQPTWRRPWQAVALSADGRLIAASLQGHVAFWSADGDGRYAPRGADGYEHEGLTRLAMDAAGRMTLSGTRTGEVRARSAGAGTSAVLLPASDRRVTALALSREGRTAAAALPGEILVWRLAADGSGTLLAREPLGQHRVRALAFDGRAERLAAGAADGSVRVWRLGASGLQAEGASHAVQSSEINVIAFAPGDGMLATGAEDSTLALWSLPALERVREFAEHRSGLVSIAFCEAGGQVRLLSSDRDGEVIARLSLEEPRHTRTLMQSLGRPRYLAVTPDCERVATSGSRALAWNLEPGFVRRQACLLGDPGEDPLSACDGVRQQRTR